MNAFAEGANGLVYIAGRFNRFGPVDANNIVAYNGTTFVPLGLGVNGQVWALFYASGRLYVGGDFITAGGTVRERIAVWNEATVAWETFTTVTPVDSVRSISVANNRVYVGGLFQAVTGPLEAFRFCIYNLDGTVFYRAPAASFDQPVNAIVGDDSGGVYIGGSFTQTP